jgi:hypothetical protein
MNAKSCGANSWARPFKWGVSKIRHGENGGNATLLGQIIDEPKK